MFQTVAVCMWLYTFASKSKAQGTRFKAQAKAQDSSQGLRFKAQAKVQGSSKKT